MLHLRNEPLPQILRPALPVFGLCDSGPDRRGLVLVEGEAMKLFLVSTGEYSDYTVRGIYSAPDKAEDAKLFYNSENEIEEFELDTLPPHPEGHLLYLVTMARDGALIDVVRSYPTEYGDSFENDHNWIPSSGGVEFTIWAFNKDQAVKVANEKRAQLIASNLWIEDWNKWNGLTPEQKVI